LDFKDNVLRIGSDAVPFLGEGDIPLHLRQAEAGDDDMDTDTGAPAKQGEDSGGAAASSTASAAATTTPPAAGVAAEFPGAAIDALTGMGFTREQALMALRSANGSAELAASLLFGGD
jgi:DNA damage-inducible protein 1